MPCLSANVRVGIVLHETEAQPLDRPPVIEAAEVDEERVGMLRLVGHESQYQLEKIRVGLGSIQDVPKSRFIRDAIRLPADRRKERQPGLFLLDPLGFCALVLRVGEAREHPHRLLNTLGSFDGELACLWDEPPFTAMPFELDQIRSNLVLRGAEQPHIVDVPCVAALLLKYEVDGQQKTLGQEVRRERSLWQAMAMAGCRPV